jgi:hypothetical protein
MLVVEMSNGQLVEDIRLYSHGKCPIHFYNRMGGVVPTAEEIFNHVVKTFFSGKK